MSFALSGLVTGLDTSTIVSQLMYLERGPQRKLQQQQAALQTKQARFQALNSALLTLQNAANALTDTSASGALQARKVTVGDSSKISATGDSTAVTGTYNVTVNQVALAQRTGGDAFTYGSGAGGALTITKDSDGTSKTINFSGTGSATDVANAINSASSGMQATVVGGKLILTGKETGETYTISDDQGGALKTAFGFDSTLQTAQNASVSIDGIATVTSKSNVFDGTAISGVKLTVSTVGSSTITVEQDQDTTVSKVQAFVNAYNAILDQIAADSKTTDQPVDPNDPTKGTYKASGAFTGDSTIRSLQMQMSQMITGIVDTDGGKYRTANDVGISTDKTGHLSLDASKLKTALTDDSFAVQKIFAHENTTTHMDSNGAMVKEINYGTTGNIGDGVAVRLSAYVDMLTNSFSQYNTTGSGGARLEALLKSRIDGMSLTIKSYDNSIASYENRMTQYETNLRNQFTAMETAISNLKSQQSQFQSALASLPGIG